MGIAFDYTSSLIHITSPQTTLSCQELLDAIRGHEASEEGIVHDTIATASGKEALDSSVSVGITVNLISPWQIMFWEPDDPMLDNYIAKVAGGNLVGGISGDPVAYSAGVQVLLVQSAASTVVTTGGSALTTAEHAKLMAVPADTDNANAVWAYERT